MLGPKVKVSKNLYRKLQAASEALGVTLEEFAQKSLDDAANAVILKGSSEKKEMSKEEEEEIAQQLRGLGYIE
jgi:hypothetical protein